MPETSPTRGAVAVEDVYPQVDCGRYPVKRSAGEPLEVWADVFKPGHDRVAAAVQYRMAGDREWREEPMTKVDNDRWVGRVELERVGECVYRVAAWTDRFATSLEGVEKWVGAGEDVGSDLARLAALAEEAAARAKGGDASALRAFAVLARGRKPEAVAQARTLLGPMRSYGSRDDLSTSRELKLTVDRRESTFASWYEMFHRSQGSAEGRGATFAECEKRLGYVESMGFDVVYLPPIHPVGLTNRRGANNAAAAKAGEPGSPWAIGSGAGGHDAINPELGTLEDFEHFVYSANELGIEVAIDLAFQCSPDHPYVRQHPAWFYHREDGTIRYAENPPKKYYDIYPLAFDNPDWEGLWEELKRVTLFWVSKGVKTFRVDNPHTKPSAFWEWLITEVKKQHPEVIFLAEAFTAPKPMKLLSKLGFSQSYTYFTWKNTKAELEEFLREFVLSDAAEYYRGNFFTNTPDILHAYLQKGGRPAFKIRLALAATLSSLYGIYNGYELCEDRPREEGSEEYADSEKYQYKVRNWDAPGNIREYVAKVNAIRRDNRALQATRNLRLLRADNEHVIFYAKWTDDKANVVLVAANLDPSGFQNANLTIPLGELGVGGDEPYLLRELITGEVLELRGDAATVALDPQREPVAVFRLERRA
jgi:starch synthase (maltosyl-transferring)